MLPSCAIMASFFAKMEICVFLCVSLSRYFNMITTPRRYFFNDEFLGECFQKLHGTIVSCHLKDIMLKQEYTFQLQECACGEGTLDIELYAQLASAENPRMPMIIEHLDADEEYVSSVRYVRQRLSRQMLG